MKKITFKPPYRVGKKSGTTVLDSNGIEVVNFRDEDKAQEYVEYLNRKERDQTFMNAIGKSMMSKADVVLTIHKPRKVDFVGALPSPYLMDEIGHFPRTPVLRDKEGNPLPWYIIDHVSLIKDPTVEKHAKNPLIGEDVAKMWAKLTKERESDPNYVPCCDENNPCCCATSSPSMASPEDVREFLENRKVKLDAPSFMIWSKLKEKMNFIKKNKKKR